MKLVCTDMDRTLLPNGEQPESPHARPILWHLLSTHTFALAYVSGRDLARVLDAIEEYDLRMPDVIVADVGTSLYTRDGDSWTPSAEWESRVLKDWNGRDSCGVEAILQDINGLHNQEEDRQSLYKRSYYYSESADESRLVDSVRASLDDNGITASVVTSHDPIKKLGLLDVLPESATKREAVSYLQTSFGLANEEIMFAGDSGNDVSALCAEQPGVLVANADTPTREAVQNALKASHSTNTYFARGSLSVAGFDSLNGNYSAGIIEGLIHFRPQWGKHLKDTDWLRAALNDSSPRNGLSGYQSA
ncbi:MAG: HAD-IIB family hydrolase [Granulosicoccus sp.]